MLSPYHPVTLSPYHPVTMSPCRRVALSPCHLVPLSPCHLVTLSPCHPVTLSPCHPVTLSPCHLVSRHRPERSRMDSLDWRFPATEPHSGVPLGNGTFGALIWGEGRDVRITINRADYWDHRGGLPLH